MPGGRGIQRERAVKHWLQERDWLVIRAAASLGPVDLVAFKAGERPWFVEVKSTAGGPYERFGPADRLKLAELAVWAGADAWLAWWPPNGKLRWIGAAEWPVARAAA